MANDRGGRSWISVTVAVIAVVLFFGWIATREPPESVAVAEPGADTIPAAAPDAPATTVEPADLTQSATARGLIGQDIELQAVPVSSALGAQMFWIELPGGSPYLVQLDSAMVASGQSVPQSGGQVRIVGRVTDKSQEVKDRWMSTQVLADADELAQAEFGTTFILARRVEPAGS